MRRLYLTPSFAGVADKVAADIDSRGCKTAFIYTAAELEHLHSEWFVRERAALERVGFDLCDYTITGKTPSEITAFLAPFDVIYVCGGDTFHFMEQVHRSSFDKVLLPLLEKKIYIGQSAGSVVMGTSVSLKADPPETTLKDLSGFGLIGCTIVPHLG